VEDATISSHPLCRILQPAQRRSNRVSRCRIHRQGRKIAATVVMARAYRRLCCVFLSRPTKQGSKKLGRSRHLFYWRRFDGFLLLENHSLAVLERRANRAARNG